MVKNRGLPLLESHACQKCIPGVVHPVRHPESGSTAVIYALACREMLFTRPIVHNEEGRPIGGFAEHSIKVLVIETKHFSVLCSNCEPICAFASSRLNFTCNLLSSISSAMPVERRTPRPVLVNMYPKTLQLLLTASGKLLYADRLQLRPNSVSKTGKWLLQQGDLHEFPRFSIVEETL